MTRPKTAAQLVFDLPVRAALGREDFMVTEANRAAVEAVERWPDWDHPVLAIVGPPASGKSHLGKVWQALSGARQIAAHDLSVETGDEIMQSPAVLIEDAPSPGMDEKALFHAINLARERSHAILVTTRDDPAHWPVRLPDLASRLKAVRVARLNAPDDALLRAVLVKQFSDRQISVDEATVAYMLTRMERSFDAARTLVDEIDRQALAEKAAVTRNFVARLMSIKD
jgi:chromosomal replication initiation ATPase DnaA